MKRRRPRKRRPLTPPLKPVVKEPTTALERARLAWGTADFLPGGDAYVEGYAESEVKKGDLAMFHSSVPHTGLWGTVQSSTTSEGGVLTEEKMAKLYRDITKPPGEAS